MAWSETLPYVIAQLAGGIAGTILAHAMFGLPLISLSRHIRSGPAQFLSECVAAFGAAVGNLGMFTFSVECSPFCCGKLHRGGSPVHGVYIFCESRRDDWEVAD